MHVTTPRNLFQFFETASYIVYLARPPLSYRAKNDFELFLLSQPPEGWNSRHALPSLVLSSFFCSIPYHLFNFLQMKPDQAGVGSTGLGGVGWGEEGYTGTLSRGLSCQAAFLHLLLALHSALTIPDSKLPAVSVGGALPSIHPQHFFPQLQRLLSLFIKIFFFFSNKTSRVRLSLL